MENKDLARLRHMLDSTNAILTFVKGKRRASVAHDIIWKTIREYLPSFHCELEEAINCIDDLKTKKRSDRRKP